MAYKQMLFHSAAREKILKGVTELADAIRIALENAVSVASILLLTEATMTEISEETSQATLPQDM